MEALLSELDKYTFLQDLLALLGIRVTWTLTNAKRSVSGITRASFDALIYRLDEDQSDSTFAINFALSPCNTSNFSQAQLVLSTITTAIAPGAPAV
jgi:hypothetical protein